MSHILRSDIQKELDFMTTVLDELHKAMRQRAPMTKSRKAKLRMMRRAKRARL